MLRCALAQASTEEPWNMILRACLLCFVAVFGGSLLAQMPDLEPGKPNYNPPVPTVEFSLDFPQGTPSHYAVAVESNGNAGYISDSGEKADPNQATPTSGTPVIDRFTVSTATAQRIFSLAGKANYFNGKFDANRPEIANTGAKTLIYADAKRHFSTTYNYSQNQDIQQLTALFQGLSATLEFGRRLRHEYRYDKLSLLDELRRMSAMAKDGQVQEVGAIAPILKQIADDDSIMHIARTEATKLLKKAGTANGAGAR
jgi:hypothetical protein